MTNRTKSDTTPNYKYKALLFAEIYRLDIVSLYNCIQYLNQSVNERYDYSTQLIMLIVNIDIIWVIFFLPLDIGSL